MTEPKPNRFIHLSRRDLVRLFVPTSVALLTAACSAPQAPRAPETPKTPAAPVATVKDLGNGTYMLPNGNIINADGAIVWNAATQKAGSPIGGSTAQPTVAVKAEPTKTVAKQVLSQENETLPPFAIYGVQKTMSFDKNDPRLPNNGKDAEGNDHRTTHLPTNLVVADPGHYRVDNISNVTDPTTKATIERDVRNGAAYAGDDYKDVLTEKTADLPLMEAGGAAMITTDHAELSFADVNGNIVTIQCGSKPKNGYVIVVQDGLDRDRVRDTDLNRTLHVSKYDIGWTMWQGIPPGKFVSDMFVSQTTADVHGTYRDRGTAPGAGHDGHTLTTVVLVKILPEGVAYQIFEHSNLRPWQEYQPSDFKQVAGNVVIK